LYAIISSGGKQYRVTEGATIDVERLDGEAGEQVSFADVLCLAGADQVQIGRPTVSGARVIGTIVQQKRAPKVLVFKFKKTKMYRKLQGHRQWLTEVRIDSFETASEQVSAQ
jgi:large subunit ribosomal protein L21